MSRLPPATCCRDNRRDAVLGWPEKLFVRINALLPRVVDGSLSRQLPTIRRYAREAALPREFATGNFPVGATEPHRGEDMVMKPLRFVAFAAAAVLLAAPAFVCG